MLVGETMSGKTSMIKTLSSALKIIHSPKETVVHHINPKAVSIGQLYGNFDHLTHDWSDGILASIVRLSVTS